MASHAMTADGAPPGSELQPYLNAFATALSGPRRRRTALVNEVADGLREASEHHGTRGLTTKQAEQAAIAEFGPPGRLAAGFADELAIAYARQTVAALLLTGPLVGIWWLLLLAPASWWQDPLSLWATIPVIPLIGAAALTGVAVIATTGHLTRWLPETRPDRALTLANGLCTACIAIDLTMLLIAGTRALTDQANGPPLLAAAAIAASGFRMTWTTRTTYRIHRHYSPADQPTSQPGQANTG